AGCSSGEEGFSISLVLEKVRLEHPHFEYRIEGWDVDPVSVATANRAIYPNTAISTIPLAFRSLLLMGSGKTKGYFTLDKAMRQRCLFKQRSLLIPSEMNFERFHVIFCRNVLIYFKADQVQTIIHSLINRLYPRGLLILGHSEAIEAKAYRLESSGNSCYRVGTAAEGVRSSSPAALVKSGSSAFAFKKSIGSMTRETMTLRKPELILVGASTGGTDALERLLKDMPQGCPPVVIVQHIAHAFAKSFAERLCFAARLKLGDPCESGPIKKDHIYMSWGDYHIGVKRHGSHFFMTTSSEAPLHSVRPSVDYLFESVAASGPSEHIFTCLLTGMGKDGAKGMLEMRRMGSMTATQDEKSSVVFGMPAEAVAIGASQ
ncbi:MAG: hypothetical protein EOP10_33485, partial [Proteobacteria bacterium]